MTTSLMRRLVDAYGFADKRHRSLAFGRPIRINANERLNSNIHCLIFARVEEGEQLELTFAGAVPWDHAVQNALSNLGTVSGNLPASVSVRFVVTNESGAELWALAEAFARVTAVGKQYPTKSWKFSSKEVHDDLTELANQLDAYTTV
jgi:hypothetical protein